MSKQLNTSINTNIDTNINTSTIAKPKFNINYYDNSFAMHCDTEEKATIFCYYLHSIDKKWVEGTSYLKENYYNVYGDKTCYDFINNQYSGIDIFKDYGITILEFDDFDWTDIVNDKEKEKEETPITDEMTNTSSKELLIKSILIKMFDKS